MYQISSDNLQHYVDNVIYIKLHQENGCYVICPEEEADGVCVKIPKEVQDEYGTFTTCEDTVFTIKEGGLNGTESLCQVQDVQVAVDYYNAKKAEALVAMLEEVL